MVSNRAVKYPSIPKTFSVNVDFWIETKGENFRKKVTVFNEIEKFQNDVKIKIFQLNFLN
ncbi:hypothetical protein AX766_06745 [Flavobacterium covae]|nr:hypothetical protein AWN65_13085 [Flavobacterium covae]OXA78172.1 hypothetical protein B0A56_09090 [Flavobacterium columnare NBRC 100251 = ATCC 23463]POR23785.1 hypothetical protein BWK57_00300 [Flavobacterium columnare]AND64130.1 hypothetical protein AX766_06745 [Flavobacterium covae]OWP82129.1 hypothetical protein BWK63_02380 [Flavobacterium covae]